MTQSSPLDDLLAFTTLLALFSIFLTVLFLSLIPSNITLSLGSISASDIISFNFFIHASLLLPCVLL